ncbi:hypothetical protein [Rhizorhabdus argentea]|uniref:hypothetical protein n=1 Tax=Rhizorhabdus argentea TaxID=1387174 RepID=UPI0030EB4445
MSDLIGFERAAYGRSPDRMTRMIGALRNMTVGTLVEDAAQPDKAINHGVLIHRLAAAIIAVFADPQVELSAEDADRLMVVAGTMRQIFELSGFGGPDVILRLLGDTPVSAPVGQIAKRLVLLSLETPFEWDPKILAAAGPRLATQLLASLIATKPVMTVRGQQRRNRLLEVAASLPMGAYPAGVDHLVLISSAWMVCSYAGTAGKHAIKRNFNGVLRDVAADLGFHDAELPAWQADRMRPVLLFAAEIMHSVHVQYRYFGQYLRQLRTRFDLVLLTEKREVDDAVAALFDRVLTFERGTDSAYLRDIARMIAETAADIIFYPSVGMRHWGPLFANLRLAPIQLTGLGHSASTFCDTIDYYLLEEGYVSDPALFGETVITLPDDSLIFERAPHYAPLPPQIREKPQPLRIVLPSNALKLNPAFLSVIARIRAEAGRPLELHLLPNASGLELDALRRSVQQILPGAIVHPTLRYDRYLEIISSCDLNLSPFPFGGLHSVIDSLRQGIPVVAMECPEPHGRTDAMLLRRLGMPEWLVARNEAEYVAASLRIIRDDALRVDLSRYALALDIDTVMFGDATTPLRSEVADALWWLYRHHESIQSDGRKLWNQADRQDLGSA